MIIKKVASEYQECKAFWSWAQTKPLVARYLIKHVNEGKRSYITAKYLQNIGMRKGLPDYQLPIPNKTWYGMWIEMKRTDQLNRRKDQDQLDWQEKLLKMNQYATFAYGWEDAAKIITDYLENNF